MSPVGQTGALLAAPVLINPLPTALICNTVLENAEGTHWSCEQLWCLKRVMGAKALLGGGGGRGGRGRSCQTLTFQHLIAGVRAWNRNMHHACSRSWPPWAMIPLTTQEEGDEVSCVDRDRTVTRGLLQAPSHAARWIQTAVGTGLRRRRVVGP